MIELAPTDSRRSNSLSQSASLSGVKMSFSDEADVGSLSSACSEDVRGADLGRA